MRIYFFSEKGELIYQADNVDFKKEKEQDTDKTYYRVYVSNNKCISATSLKYEKDCWVTSYHIPDEEIPKSLKAILLMWH